TSLAYVNRLIGDELRGGLAALVRHRLGEKVSLLGWEVQEGESELDRQLRGDLLRPIGPLGDDAEIQARAREVYARYREHEVSLGCRGEGVGGEPTALPAVIAIVAAAGGEPEYTEFRERFKSARTPQEEQRYLYALAGFRSPELLSRTLEMTLNGEIRSQDA